MSEPAPAAPEEPEVLPPERDVPPAPRRSAAERVFGPVIAGLLIDMIDLALWGPMGVLLGLFIGGGMTWYLTSFFQIRPAARIAWTLAAGIYCALPFTQFVPLGTLVGLVIRYYEYRTERAREAAEGNPPA